MKTKYFFLSHILLFVVSVCFADELAECRRLAIKYKAETEWRIIDDGSRIDLLNDEYAFEADWAHKWTEAVGQSLFYALKTNRKPAIILLIKDEKKDQHFVDRCKLVCDKYRITLFVEKATLTK